MSEPLAELDQRFSDPGATATPWSVARKVLEAAQLSWITTVRVDGRPHVTPLVTVWLEDAVYFATGPGEQKAVNLNGNPKVAMLTGCNSWNEGTLSSRVRPGRSPTGGRSSASPPSGRPSGTANGSTEWWKADSQTSTTSSPAASFWCSR
jgi:hypothetical protein